MRKQNPTLHLFLFLALSLCAVPGAFATNVGSLPDVDDGGKGETYGQPVRNVTVITTEDGARWMPILSASAMVSYDSIGNCDVCVIDIDENGIDGVDFEYDPFTMEVYAKGESYSATASFTRAGYVSELQIEGQEIPFNYEAKYTYDGEYHLTAVTYAVSNDSLSLEGQMEMTWEDGNLTTSRDSCFNDGQVYTSFAIYDEDNPNPYGQPTFSFLMSLIPQAVSAAPLTVLYQCLSSLGMFGKLSASLPVIFFSAAYPSFMCNFDFNDFGAIQTEVVDFDLPEEFKALIGEEDEENADEDSGESHMMFRYAYVEAGSDISRWYNFLGNDDESSSEIMQEFSRILFGLPDVPEEDYDGDWIEEIIEEVDPEITDED